MTTVPWTCPARCSSTAAQVIDGEEHDAVEWALMGDLMESAWSNGKPAYRCRHGHTSATSPTPGRPKNTYVREVRLLPQLPALHVLLTGVQPAERRRRRTRRRIDVPPVRAEKVIGYLREAGTTPTYDPATATLHAGAAGPIKTVTVKAS
jgi:site-specific DNA recombinase